MMSRLPAVNRLGVGGKAIMPLRVTLGGPELLRGTCQWIQCSLQLTYVGHRFAVSAAPTAPLFAPPLALQVTALCIQLLTASCPLVSQSPSS